MNRNIKARQLANDAYLAQFNGGKIEFMPAGAGGKPASADTAIAADQTPLATITPLPTPAFNASNGTATAALSAAVTDLDVDIVGTPVWGRMSSPDGLTILDFTVGATGGGADVTFDNIAWTLGVPVTANSITVQELP